MPDYRVYCLGDDGRIGLADWLEADSDEQAILKARETRRGADRCEVWLKNRLIAKLNFADSGV